MAGAEAEEVAREIAELKAAYGNDCRIIKNSGDIIYVIDVKLKNYNDLSIKFQLDDSYPNSIPQIIVKANKMSADQKVTLTDRLTSCAVRCARGRMLEQLMQEATEWVSDHKANFSSGSAPAVQEEKSKGKWKGKYTKKGKGKKAKHDSGSGDDVDEILNEKKPPMKTATDVVKRILWEESLPTDLFTIGYMDRMLGVVEKNFEAFSWEDIASVDYDTLAIPKHRIQYFKYKDLKVWDKNKRMDNVFGSTGSGLNIHDVIDKYEEEKRMAKAGGSEEAQAVGGASGAAGVVNDSDDEDDGVVINTSMPQMSDEDEDDEDEIGAKLFPKEKYWGPKSRPTHFLCLRVTDPEVVKAMEEVHSQITDMLPHYERCIIPADRIHVTLACVGLDTEDQIAQAASLLQRLQPELRDMNPEKMKVNFRGTDHFFDSVLYSKVDCDQEFLDFVDHLRVCIREAGIAIRDIFEFTPHMTIVKLKGQDKRDFHCPYLDGRLHSRYDELELGSQSVDNIYLCKMSQETASDGFYICPSHITFP